MSRAACTMRCGIRRGVVNSTWSSIDQRKVSFCLLQFQPWAGITGWMCVNGSHLAMKYGRDALNDRDNGTLVSVEAGIFVQKVSKKDEFVGWGTTRAMIVRCFKQAGPKDIIENFSILGRRLHFSPLHLHAKQVMVARLFWENAMR